MPDDLDDLSGVPRYLQVARVIEAEIRSGQWTPGNAVPSRNQLAERFGIARETAARAHAWLARAGYLVAVPGVGMVVTGPKKPSDTHYRQPLLYLAPPCPRVTTAEALPHPAADELGIAQNGKDAAGNWAPVA